MRLWGVSWSISDSPEGLEQWCECRRGFTIRDPQPGAIGSLDLNLGRRRVPDGRLHFHKVGGVWRRSRHGDRARFVAASFQSMRGKPELFGDACEGEPLAKRDSLRPQRLGNPPSRGSAARPPLGKLQSQVSEEVFCLRRGKHSHGHLPSCVRVRCSRKVSAFLCLCHACSPERHSPHVFSMASWKQRHFNERLLDVFIENLALDPIWVKNHPGYEKLRTYGAIAA